MRLYLASRSPQRLELLRRAGYEVVVVPSDVPEPPLTAFPSGDSYALCTAWLKAAEARRHVPRGLLVAADTVVAIGGEILRKPRDRQDAARMLRLMSGGWQEVLTGLAVCKMPDEIYVGAVDRTRLRTRKLAEPEITAYLDSGQWQEKAGGYAIQEGADPFVEEREGSLSNVIGLPLERLKVILEQFGWLLEGEG